MSITWNPADKTPDIVLSNGDLTATKNKADSFWDGCRATLPKSSGKWYWEVLVVAIDDNHYIGIGTSAASLTTRLGYDNYGYSYSSKDGKKWHSQSGVNYGSTYGISGIIGIGLDLDNGKIWWSKNGVWQASGDPGAGTNPAYTGVFGTFFPAWTNYSNTSSVTARFASGDLTYSPPSGFSAYEHEILINLFNGKVRIKDTTTKLFDGKVGIKDTTIKLFDGKVLIGLFDTDLFDGKVQIKNTISTLFDGKAQIKDTTFVLFDGKANIVQFSTDLFDGKAQIKDSIVDLFDGRVQIKDSTAEIFDGKIEIGFIQRQSFLGNLGELFKLDLISSLGFLSRFDLLLGFGILRMRIIFGALGETIDYLLYIPMAQTGIQQIVNHLSSYIADIQILINELLIGDPFSSKQDLFGSIQGESSRLFLCASLSEVRTKLQVLLNALTTDFSSGVSLINELALKNDIQSILVLLDSMSDHPALYPDCSLNVYLNGVPINKQIVDFSFVLDREVTFDVFSFSSTDMRLYAELQKIVSNKDSALEIQYKGTSWFFLIEEVSGYELSFNVWGRSIAAAKSDAPFEDSVNFVLETDTLASVVAEDLVPNLSVAWNVVDWTILAGWSVDGTPVQMLKELADSVGAVVRSYPDGTGFYVDEKYTTRPVDLPYAAPVEDYDRDVDLISLDANRDLGTGANTVTVHGHTPFSKYSIRLEAEGCVDVGNLAAIKVYPALEGAGYRLVASEGVPVYQHSLSEEHIEIVSFVGGKGSVSYPITSLKSITWDGAAPAGFEHTPGQDEIVLTDDTLAAVGEVVYSTRYDVWHGAHSGEGQLLVVCYLDEGGGIVAKVYFGEGDHEADDIDRPILTSIEAAVAAGQAFLDDTSYNRLLRAIVVPCSDVSDGDVVSVLSDLSGVAGNMFVLKHEISARLDNEALKIISNLNVVQFEV